MLYSADFRRIARDGLYGRWGTAVGAGLMALLFGATIHGIEDIFSITVRLSDDDSFIRVSFDSFREIFQSPLAGLILLVIVWAVISLILGGAVTLGYAKFNLDLVADDRRDVYVSDLFSQFNRLWAGFCMRFLINLYVFLWSLLFIIPGIIAAYSYSMTPYIMVEHPEYGVNEAISASKEMMRGNRWRLFCLHISFIGWRLLCLLTCGIGFLWLNPYIEAANAAFYKEISTGHDRYYRDEYKPEYIGSDYMKDNNIFKLNKNDGRRRSHVWES